MDFGSILEGFWAPNSHFFRCFFEDVLEARFRRRKNRAPKPKKAQKARFLEPRSGVRGVPGEGFREGKHENLMRHLRQGVR